MTTPLPLWLEGEQYHTPPQGVPDWLAFTATHRPRAFPTEERLQYCIMMELRSKDNGTGELLYERELTLPGDAGRIDFAVWDRGIRYGVECKVKTNGMSLWRQLERYAPFFDALIVVTTWPTGERVELLRPGGYCMPATIDDKAPGEPLDPLEWQDGERVPVTIVDLWKNL